MMQSLVIGTIVQVKMRMTHQRFLVSAYWPISRAENMEKGQYIKAIHADQETFR